MYATTSRFPINPNWQGIPIDGFPIRNPGESRPAVFFRLSASYDGGIYTPASRRFRIIPHNFANRNPQLLCYAAEKFRFVRNAIYSTDGGLTWSQPLTTRAQSRADVSEYITNGTTIRYFSVSRLNATLPRRILREFATLSRAEFADWTLTLSRQF